MQPEAILYHLAHAEGLPEDAIRAARAQRDLVAPLFVDLVEFTARSERSLIVSGPSIWRSSMWCDWSKSALASRHATCSSRQFENSDGTAG